ncbi:MAG: hypothetical protein OP8BY_1038 [Candidatus Saccharicenans subterraneus]|uniref:Uncharacterized protein n=1 Tax=Candidatus Saccharicenans subterraneus TaxID=2508984 RepID=A0A3E2BR45_9BACT|nr:MAG: hypothetical protein OP8BY_1038 [Candidatus Saccharicenans subterraneum]
MADLIKIKKDKSFYPVIATMADEKISIKKIDRSRRCQ